MPSFAAASPWWVRGLRFTPSRASGFRSIRAAGITPFISAPGPSPTCPGCWRCSCALNHEDAKITKAHENYKYLLVFRVFVMTEPRRRPDSASLLSWAPGSVSAWQKTGHANWRVVDGVIEADKPRGFLLTKESYGDFDLRAEIWVTPDSNGGVLFRI